MNADQNPLSSMFEMQRTYIEASRQAVTQSIEFQKEAAEAVIESFDPTASAQQDGVEMTRRAFHAAIDGMEPGLPADTTEELRSAVDDQYDALVEVHGETWESLEDTAEDAIEGYDELTETQTEMVDEMYEMMSQAMTDAESMSDGTTVPLSTDE
ncbi:hypothetical protein [Haloquadratum walsbyi]|jgi:hypothetical protein|uniref:hypothetical protein n=1 Tax=Haloquadratum walsbyi TaxID=293091 RepID=UPI0023F05713|nr:hypothetical protein [Haloquadratum walsbyi]